MTGPLGVVKARAAELVEGLQAAIAMVSACPELMDQPGFALAFAQIPIRVYGDDALEAVSRFAVAGAQAGAEVDHDIVGDEVWASINVRLSPVVCLWVYGGRERLVEGDGARE